MLRKNESLPLLNEIKRSNFRNQVLRQKLIYKSRSANFSRISKLQRPDKLNLDLWIRQNLRKTIKMTMTNRTKAMGQLVVTISTQRSENAILATVQRQVVTHVEGGRRNAMKQSQLATTATKEASFVKVTGPDSLDRSRDIPNKLAIYHYNPKGHMTLHQAVLSTGNSRHLHILPIRLVDMMTVGSTDTGDTMDRLLISTPLVATGTRHLPDQQAKIEEMAGLGQSGLIPNHRNPPNNRLRLSRLIGCHLLASIQHLLLQDRHILSSARHLQSNLQSSIDGTWVYLLGNQVVRQPSSAPKVVSEAEAPIIPPI